MVDLSKYYSKYLTYQKAKPEESFIYEYVDKCLESNSAISPAQSICIILYVKYKNVDLNKVMAKQRHHLNVK